MEFLNLVQIELFLFIFARLATILFLLPVFGTKQIPVHYRLGLGVFLTILFFPLLVSSYDPPSFTSPWQIGVVVLKEAVIGMMIGYFTLFLFASLKFAGYIVDLQMGFAMVQLPDPMGSGETIGGTGMFYVLMFGLIYLIFDGHYFLFLALDKSFQLIPVGEMVYPSKELAMMAVDTVGKLFEVSLRIAAPILIILVITSIALGIIAKTMPQMNILFVGMPLKIGVGFIALLLTLPTAVYIFKTVLEQLYKDIWLMLKVMAG